MADGDLILPLEFDETDLGDPIPPFELGSCAQELYDALAPLAYDDPNQEWVLARVCDALGRLRQPISDLVHAWKEPGVAAVSGRSEEPRERTSLTVTMRRSGWSRAVHPSRAPGADDEIDMLPFLGQLVGVRNIEPLSDHDRREAIKNRDGFARGTLPGMLSYASRFTTGGGVTVRERYDPALGLGVDAPHHGRVIMQRSRLKLPRVNHFLSTRAEVTGDSSVLSISTVGFVTPTRVPWTATGDAALCFSVSGTHPADSTARYLGLSFNDPTSAPLPVVGSRAYTASAQVETTQTTANPDDGYRWRVQWMDAGRGNLTVDDGPIFDDLGAVGKTVWGTFVAPPSAAYARFSVVQVSTTPSEPLGFKATAFMLEEGTVLNPFADALTPGWRSLGALWRSRSQGPGREEDEIAASILRRIPAGLIYDVVISDQRDYDAVSRRWSTYDQLRAAGFVSYDDLLGDDYE